MITEPRNIAALQKDHALRPVPWFVAWIDGVPDFRVARQEALYDAVKFDLCWICGKTMGTYKAFLIGPMCAVNKTTAEPPAHRECAVFAATVCPFLARPSMRRRTTGLPEDKIDPPGEMILRNPGAVLVWITKSFRTFRPPTELAPEQRGFLFEIGPHTEVLWFAEGRPATRDQALESLQSGLPILNDAAKADGPEAQVALIRDFSQALKLVPGEAS